MILRFLFASLLLSLFWVGGCSIYIGDRTPNNTHDGVTSFIFSNSHDDVESIEVVWDKALDQNSESAEWEGVWKGEIDSENVFLNFSFEEKSERINEGGFQFLTNEAVITKSKSNGDALEINRESGRLFLTESSNKKDAVRFALFQPNSKFVAEISEVVGGNPNRLQILQAFAFNFTSSELAEYRKAESKISYEEIISLRRNGISGTKAASFKAVSSTLTTEDIISLHRNGVPVDFISEVNKHRPTMETEDFIELRRNGVPSDYVAAITSAGYDYNAEEFVNLRRNGVPEDYITELNTAGYAFSVDELISLRRNGVPSDFATELKKNGKNLDADELIELRRNGVPEEFITEAKSLGYDYSAEEYIELRRNGVTTDYLQSIQVPNRKPLPVKDIIDLRRRGVPADVVRSLRSVE